MVLGITPLGWAQWLAKALDLPYTSYAFNGATAADRWNTGGMFSLMRLPASSRCTRWTAS